MLKAITFDFWQTLYADSDSNWRKRQAILSTVIRTSTVAAMLAH